MHNEYLDQSAIREPLSRRARASRLLGAVPAQGAFTPPPGGRHPASK